ncbi:zinc protease [Faunimonas pinastri]|uniref:Zinc protease n=1 Tax=Faunimonas pinastri TaxID=1855383 RepID=A0A1H8ZJT4_9HYPH|nr:pitrilysin family protein [Faunimonas pinastri]SEP64682.1 zinc protease [Faunimonas pinastri]
MNSPAHGLPHRTGSVTVQEVTSPGGLSAWLVEDYTVPIVTVNIAFRGGAAQEPKEKSGLTNMVSALLDEGAGDLDSQAFQMRLADLNINLSFDAGQDTFHGNLRTLKLNEDAAFDMLRLAITQPRFDAEPLERIRNQMLSNLRSAETEPHEIASKAWWESLFAEHPYGRQTHGTPETVAAIDAEDCRLIHRRLLARDNLYVVVVGAIDAASLGRQLDHVFGDLPAASQLTHAGFVTPTAGQVLHLPLSVPQTTIHIGGAGINRDDPDFMAAYVANHIIGGGTFSSRMFKEVREKRGLSYSVGTGLVPLEHSGAWIGSAATRTDKARTAIDVMLEQAGDVAASGPTDEELAKAKQYLIGNYALRFDASQKIARQLIHIYLDRLGVDYINRRNQLIRDLTHEDVKRAASRVFGGPVTIVTVGEQAP